MTTQLEKTGSPFSADINRVLFNLNSSFNPLHKDFILDYHVSGAKNGYVYLSIALPEGMTRVFVNMLESLVGFFRFIDIKSRSAVAQAKSYDLAGQEKARTTQETFKNDVCALFDKFRYNEGLAVNDAVKKVNLALKERNHPWATYEVVLHTLRRAGKLRKAKPL